MSTGGKPVDNSVHNLIPARPAECDEVYGKYLLDKSPLPSLEQVQSSRRGIQHNPRNVV
jgi:hypothetical protein